MEETLNAKVLLVDDDPVSLKILNVLLSKEPMLEVFQAISGEEGIKLARKVRPDIIISDYYMPGIDGFQFCQYIKRDKELNKTIFILLTAETDVIKKATTLEGGADDYIEKNVSTNVLLGKIRAFLRIKRLQNELLEERNKLNVLNELLEKNFNELTNILLKILEVQIPGASDRAYMSRDMAVFIAREMNIPEEAIKNISFGAMLKEIGKVGLSDQINKKNVNELTALERDAYFQHPIIGSIIISSLSGFKDAARYIYHQYENHDGTGIPDGLIGAEIPVGAKILRAINYYQELLPEGLSSDEIIEQIRLASYKKLDPVVTSCIVDFIINQNSLLSSNKTKIPLEELKEGMVIAEDVYSAKGIKIIPKNVKIKDWMLRTLMERDSVDPIIGGVYIFVE
ncbi:MAG: response regulator [Syntrophorhabdaceae bacterium]|nr:response regulator [Syntrophorhabdaceae bacterium]